MPAMCLTRSSVHFTSSACLVGILMLLNVNGLEAQSLRQGALQEAKADIMAWANQLEDIVSEFLGEDDEVPHQEEFDQGVLNNTQVNVAQGHVEEKASIPEVEDVQHFGASEGKLLFTLPGLAKIMVMNLNGSEIDDLSARTNKHEGCSFCKTATGISAASFIGDPVFLAADSMRNKVFWSEKRGLRGDSGLEKFEFNASVFSASLDSEEVSPVATSAFLRPPPNYPDGREGCDRDSDWSCPPASLHEAQFGPQGNFPITRLDAPYGIALDPQEQMVYWTELGTRAQLPKIRRASYDGVTSPPEVVPVDGLVGTPQGIAIDYRPGHRMMYWIEYVNAVIDPITGDQLTGSQIRRAHLDGSRMEVLASWLSRQPIGLALDLENNHFYWTDYIGGKIQRCALSGCPAGHLGIGSSPEVVLQAFDGRISANSPKLGGIALDAVAGKMYWAESHERGAPPGEKAMIWGGMIKSANLDGTEVRELYRHVGDAWNPVSPFGVTVISSMVI